MTESVKGFVLRIHPVRDRDCYLHVLTPDRGVISVFASRVLQTRHPLHALAQPYSLVQLDVLPGRSGLLLVDGEVQARFPRIQRDIAVQSRAAQLSAFVQDLAAGAEDAAALYTLLAYAYHALDSGGMRGDCVVACAQLWALGQTGFALTPARFGPVSAAGFCRFDPGGQGGVGVGQQLSPGAVEAVLHTQTALPERLFRARMDAGVERQLVGFARAYAALCLEKDYHKGAYLEALADLETWAQAAMAGRKAVRPADATGTGPEADGEAESVPDEAAGAGNADPQPAAGAAHPRSATEPPAPAAPAADGAPSAGPETAVPPDCNRRPQQVN